MNQTARTQQYLESARKITSPDMVIFEPSNESPPPVVTRSLKFLPFEAREQEIRRLALEHHQKEIRCGHVKNGCRTKDYQRHELSEVNDRLFGVHPHPLI